MHILSFENLTNLQEEEKKNEVTQLVMSSLSRKCIRSVAFNPMIRTPDFMTHIVQNETKIRDQMSTGTCWLQAAITLLDMNARNQDPEISAPLSVTYLSFYDKVEKANFYLNAVKSRELPEKDRYMYYLCKGENLKLEPKVGE